LWLLGGFLLMNLLVLLEVADRLSLKRDLEVAREIQQAMLPEGTWSGPGVEAFGLTKPANTVGGDFYDILPQPDGTVLVALGDVAGKASPAALLMALLLAILRTLADEGLPLPALVKRLNLQVARHAPASRFITLFSRPAPGGPPARQRRPDTPLSAGKWIDERLMSGGVAGHVRRQHEGSQLDPRRVADVAAARRGGKLTAPFDEAGWNAPGPVCRRVQQSAAGELGRR
jgi:hypothetical protein